MRARRRRAGMGLASSTGGTLMPYVLNHQNVTLSDEPVLKNGRNYVPLEEVVLSL